MSHKVMSVLSFVRRNFVLVVSLGFLGGFAAVHLIWYIHPSDFDSFDDLEAALAGGQPTIINFYSNL